MEIKIKGFVVSDTGVKEFKTDRDKIIKYRQIGVVGLKDLDPVNISVPIDANIKIHSEIATVAELERKNNKLKVSIKN